MKVQRMGVLAVGLLLISTTPASARKWTDNTGKYSIEAILVEAKDGRVRLKRQDGKIITVPISKLSKADQSYLDSIAKVKERPTDAKDRVETANLIYHFTTFRDKGLSIFINHGIRLRYSNGICWKNGSNYCSELKRE